MTPPSNSSSWSTGCRRGCSHDADSVARRGRCGVDARRRRGGDRRWPDRGPAGPAEAAPMTGTLARLGPLVPRMPDSPKQRIAEDGLMFRCLVGSGVHGTAIGGQDDRDEMGVTVEPEPYILGHRELGHYQYRTQPEGECSGPGDLDLIVYGLRKYVALTVAGNPTVLTTLFTRDDHVEYADEFGAELRAQRDMFLSRRAVPKFLGYLRSQRDGLLGLRSGGTNNKGRASIRERYGFDCYLDDTEFLTRRGWQRYDDIPDGEAIGTVNQETGAVEFQVPTERIE